jgi:hypothetical protein
VGEDEAAEVRTNHFALAPGLLGPAQTLVVDLANSDVEGQRVGVLRLVRPDADVEHVEDRVGTFTREPNWFGARTDEDAFDLIGDVACPSTPSSPSWPAAFRRRSSPVTVAAPSSSG